MSGTQAEPRVHAHLGKSMRHAQNFIPCAFSTTPHTSPFQTHSQTDIACSATTFQRAMSSYSGSCFFSTSQNRPVKFRFLYRVPFFLAVVLLGLAGVSMTAAEVEVTDTPPVETPPPPVVEDPPPTPVVDDPSPPVEEDSPPPPPVTEDAPEIEPYEPEYVDYPGTLPEDGDGNDDTDDDDGGYVEPTIPDDYPALDPCDDAICDVEECATRTDCCPPESCPNIDPGTGVQQAC